MTSESGPATTSPSPWSKDDDSVQAEPDPGARDAKSLVQKGFQSVQRPAPEDPCPLIPTVDPAVGIAGYPRISCFGKGAKGWFIGGRLGA
jgi:hypothetical protein